MFSRFRSPRTKILIFIVIYIQPVVLNYKIIFLPNFVLEMQKEPQTHLVKVQKLQSNAVEGLVNDDHIFLAGRIPQGKLLYSIQFNSIY